MVYKQVQWQDLKDSNDSDDNGNNDSQLKSEKKKNHLQILEAV